MLQFFRLFPVMLLEVVISIWHISHYSHPLKKLFAMLYSQNHARQPNITNTQGVIEDVV
jgi:hypothetical protein